MSRPKPPKEPLSYTEKVMRTVNTAFYIFAVIFFITAFEYLAGPFHWLLPLDSTDSPTERSGMALMTDYGTGCQYLSYQGLTPRLNQDGKHICNPSLRTEHVFKPL